MKKLVLIAGLLLSIGSLIQPNTARAQDAPIMALDPTLMAGWSGNLAYGNTSASKATAAKKINFSYTSSPVLRQSVVADFTKRLQSQSPKGAQAIATAFGPGKADYGIIYSQMLKTSALHDYDAADALTGLILVGYQIVNDVPDAQVTAGMERAARAQIAGILASNGKLKLPAARARMAEEIKLQTVVLALGLQETLKNNTVKAYRQSIAAMFQRSYHLNLYQFKLTNRGLGKR